MGSTAASRHGELPQPGVVHRQSTVERAIEVITPISRRIGRRFGRSCRARVDLAHGAIVAMTPDVCLVDVSINRPQSRTPAVVAAPRLVLARPHV
jgi:hypothetical protein